MVTGPETRVVAARSGAHIAGALAAELGATVGHLATRRLENENLLCEAHALDVAGRDVLLVATSCSPVSDHLLELLFGLDALRAAGPARLTAVIPYFPYARSDRPEAPGAPVAARQVAGWIESAGADRIVTFDLHSPQIAGFFRVPVVELAARDVLGEAVRRWELGSIAVASPDLGGAKRAAAFAELLHAPLALMRKRREAGRTAALELLGDVRGRTLLIIDDEIATGGTILSGASMALEGGARAVVAAATHAVFAADALTRLETSPLERILVTDTVPLRPEQRSRKVEVASIVQTLADALRGSQRGPTP
jgi:ribose-phosphate pyrophosphokinase